MHEGRLLWPPFRRSPEEECVTLRLDHRAVRPQKGGQAPFSGCSGYAYFAAFVSSISTQKLGNLLTT
jgi:hypothetical protein